METSSCISHDSNYQNFTQTPPLAPPQSSLISQQPQQQLQSINYQQQFHLPTLMHSQQFPGLQPSPQLNYPPVQQNYQQQSQSNNSLQQPLWPLSQTHTGSSSMVQNPLIQIATNTQRSDNSFYGNDQPNANHLFQQQNFTENSYAQYTNSVQLPMGGINSSTDQAYSAQSTIAKNNDAERKRAQQRWDNLVQKHKQEQEQQQQQTMLRTPAPVVVPPPTISHSIQQTSAAQTAAHGFATTAPSEQQSQSISAATIQPNEEALSMYRQNWYHPGK